MRRAARADQHAAHEQLDEVLREPAERGDAADESDAPGEHVLARVQVHQARQRDPDQHVEDDVGGPQEEADRKSTRLNSSHRTISYAVFCLKKKTKEDTG